MPLSDLLDILKQYRGASALTPPETVEEDYAQVAQSAPRSHLASGLAEAFGLMRRRFGQMLGTLFSNSNGQQRAGILNQLLGAVGPGLLASGGLSRLAGLLRGGNKKAWVRVPVVARAARYVHRLDSVDVPRAL